MVVLFVPIAVLWGRAAPALTLLPGDILVTDQSQFGPPPGVLRVDPVTGVVTPVSQGGYFIFPRGIAVTPRGQILVAGTLFIPGSGGMEGVVRVSQAGLQTLITSGGILVGAIGIAVGAGGDIFVVDQHAFGGPGGVIRVDPKTGAQSVVSSGGHFIDPFGIAIGPQGDFFVTDVTARAVIRVDPGTGAQSVVSSGGEFIDPAGIAIGGNGQILVADDLAVGSGTIIGVDPASGEQTILSSGGLFVHPEGVAVAPNGDLLVVDLDAFGDPCFGGCGGVIRVDAATGMQTAVSSGQDLIQPVGIALFTRIPGPGSAVLVASGVLLLAGIPNLLRRVSSRGTASRDVQTLTAVADTTSRPSP